MKAIKLTLITLFALFALVPDAISAKLNGKEANNGFEFMTSKRIPVIFKDDVDISNTPIHSLSFIIKIYISYPYVINNDVNKFFFDEQSTPPKFNRKTADNFGRWVLLNMKNPELSSYNEYLEYSQSKTSIYTIIIDTEGNISNVSPISQSMPEPIESQFVELLKNSPAWAPASVKKENVSCAYMIVVNFGEIGHYVNEPIHPLMLQKQQEEAEKANEAKEAQYVQPMKVTTDEVQIH